MARDGERATQRLARRVSAAEAGLSLLDLLERWLPALIAAPVPRSRLRAAVLAGVVRVDGRPLRAPGRPLSAGRKVDALLCLDALRPATERTDRPFTFTPEVIVYRDEWLIAVSKPVGLPTHPTADPRRPSLVGHLEHWLADSGRRPHVAVHQRLDRDTSGIVLFALHADANAGLARAFERREVEKDYLALTARPAVLPRLPLVVEAPLSTDVGGGVRVGGPDSRPAATVIRVRERLGAVLLVEARPRTGRKHQVRVHLAHAGWPILGDRLYGGELARSVAVPRLMLHAWRLSLRHPLSGRRLVVESPLPEDFRAVLRAARDARRRRR